MNSHPTGQWFRRQLCCLISRITVVLCLIGFSQIAEPSSFCWITPSLYLRIFVSSTRVVHPRQTSARFYATGLLTLGCPLVHWAKVLPKGIILPTPSLSGGSRGQGPRCQFTRGINLVIVSNHVCMANSYFCSCLISSLISRLIDPCIELFGSLFCFLTHWRMSLSVCMLNLSFTCTVAYSSNSVW